MLVGSIFVGVLAVRAKALGDFIDGRSPPFRQGCVSSDSQYFQHSQYVFNIELFNIQYSILNTHFLNIDLLQYEVVLSIEY